MLLYTTTFVQLFWYSTSDICLVHICSFNLLTDNPYIVSLNGSFLKVEQGSTPSIDFMVAVDSDGVTELHTSVKKYLMFSFTNNNLTTVFLPLPHMDPNNFQHYSYRLPPMDSNWAGNYTLSFNG